MSRMERSGMELRPVDEAGLDDAIAILGRGFPDRSSRDWEAAFGRLAALGQGNGAWPIGYFLVRGGRTVGILLTLASERVDAEGKRVTIVNLSSWYVEDDSRLMAPIMLKQILGMDEEAAFTDLTAASDSLSELNRRLGFEPWTTDRALLFLPRCLLWREGRGRVREPGPDDPLSESWRAMIDAHQRVGCVAAVLESDGAGQPLLFAPARRRGIPFARLIHAADRRAVIRNIGAVGAFLMRRGFFLLALDVTDDERPPGVVLRQPKPTWYRGAMDPAATDYAWSEYVSILR